MRTTVRKQILMLQFFSLSINDIRQETVDCVSIAFDVPASLASTFQFKAGQYLSFRKMLGEKEIRRSYSICSSPNDEELRVAIKKVPNGKFSTYANEQLSIGDTLEVMPPMGKLNSEFKPTHEKNYLAFAAGSGITPILSILKTGLQQEPKSHFTLIYGNRSIDRIIFRESIEALKNQYLDRLSVHHVLSGAEQNIPLFSGRITAQKCQQFFKKLINPSQIDEFFICGPEDMMLAIRAVIESFDVSPQKIHVELFTASTPKKQANKNKTTNNKESVNLNSTVRIQIDGNNFVLQVPYNSSNILEKGSAAGIDLPYACKGGVCCTCKAKLLEGKVEMNLNYGLEPDEIEAGYILTCQAQPRSKKIVIDYDV